MSARCTYSPNRSDAAPPGRPAIGVDVDRDVRMRAVEHIGTPVHAWPDAVVAGPGQHHRGAGLAQVPRQVHGDVEVELGLGVAAGGLGARGVAVLPFPPVPYLAAQEGGVGVVEAVVPRVDPDDL